MEMFVTGSVSLNINQLGNTEAYIMKYSWSAKAGTDWSSFLSFHKSVKSKKKGLSIDKYYQVVVVSLFTLRIEVPELAYSNLDTYI